jgi:N-acetylneuraminic acid mutarotase
MTTIDEVTSGLLSEYDSRRFTSKLFTTSHSASSVIFTDYSTGGSAGTKPTDRGGSAMVFYNGKFYLSFGEEGNGFLQVYSDSWVYDPVLDEWNAFPTTNTPEARYATFSSIIQTKYSLTFGGSSHLLSAELFALDLSTGTYYNVNATGTMPPGRQNHAGGMIGTDLFITGGLTAEFNDLANDLYKLDTSHDPTNTSDPMVWSKLTPNGTIYNPRTNMAFCICNGKLYLFGGDDNSIIRNDFFVLDTTANSGQGTWSRLRDGTEVDAPSARVFGSMVAIDTKIFMFGGSSDYNSVLNDLQVYDTIANTWTILRVDGNASNPSQRMFAPICKGTGSFVLIFGGFPFLGFNAEAYNTGFYGDFSQGTITMNPIAIGGGPVPINATTFSKSGYDFTTGIDNNGFAFINVFASGLTDSGNFQLGSVRITYS